MNLQNKIKEINKKPEHIRIRYAWIFSFVITFFVVVLWAVSLMTQKNENENASAPITPDAGAIANNPDQQPGSIQNTANNLQNPPQTAPDPNAIPNNSTIDPSADPGVNGTDSIYDNSSSDSTDDGTDDSGSLPVDNSSDSSVVTPSPNSPTQTNNSPAASPTQNPAAAKTTAGKEGFKAQN